MAENYSIPKFQCMNVISYLIECHHKIHYLFLIFHYQSLKRKDQWIVCLFSVCHYIMSDVIDECWMYFQCLNDHALNQITVIHLLSVAEKSIVDASILSKHITNYNLLMLPLVLFTNQLTAGKCFSCDDDSDLTLCVKTYEKGLNCVSWFLSNPFHINSLSTEYLDLGTNDW